MVADKENLDVGSSSTTKDVQSLHSSQKSAKELCREYPRTPVGRVPLLDLITNGDDFEKSPVRSPMERVAWNHLPDSSQDYMTPITRQGKKRARSSSPLSQRNTLTRKPTFDLQNLQASLKTPQIDPAVDLENRYFSKLTHNTPSKPSASAAADLMHSSSPQTPALTSSENAKLRRTMSCGVQWPNTSKRRKVSKSRLVWGKGAAQATEKAGNNHEAVAWNFLLDQIQDDLNASTKKCQADIASSSPTSRNHVTIKHHLSSQETLRQQTHEGTGPLGPAPTPSAETVAQGGGLESEFDDEDLDSVMMSAVDTVTEQLETTQAKVNWPSKMHGPDLLAETARNRIQPDENIPAKKAGWSSTSLNEQLPQDASKHSEVKGRAIYDPSVDADDDLGDDDDDIFDDQFAADLESVAKLYDRQQSETVQNTDNPPGNLSERPGKPNVAALVEVSSDEEFEEGIDFEEIADEFERATQANRAGPSVGSSSETI